MAPSVRFVATTPAAKRWAVVVMVWTIMVVTKVVGWTTRVVVASPAPPKVYTPTSAVADVPVPIIPRVAWIAIPRVVPRIVVVPAAPAVIPRRIDGRSGVSSAPGAKHRSDVAWLNPHLITRHHNVVKRWIVGRNVAIRATIAQIIIRRWHTIRRRLKARQATCIGTLVVIGHKARIARLVRGVILDDDQAIGVDALTTAGHSNSGSLTTLGCCQQTCRLGLILGLQGQCLGTTSLSLSTTCFCLGLLTLGDGDAVVRDIHIIIGTTRPCRVECRRATCRHKGYKRYNYQFTHISHNRVI